MLPTGTRLGTYEVVALLGAGGMGEVYRARDTTHTPLGGRMNIIDIFVTGEEVSR